MASAKLRKAFHYDDSGEDDIPDELDEEEQENLIAQLREKDGKRNDIYKRIFLVLPLISATVFLPNLTTSPSPQIRLISLLAISSLLCTAYVLLFLPFNKGAEVPSTREGPIRRYIDYLNGGLSIVVGLNAFHFGGQKTAHDGFWLSCLLPSAVFFLVVLARRTMHSVDIDGLEKLKYPYKGA